MLATEMLPKNIRFRELFSLRIFRQCRVGGNPTSDATGAAVRASKVSAAAHSDPFLHFCAGSVGVLDERHVLAAARNSGERLLRMNPRVPDMRICFGLDPLSNLRFAKRLTGVGGKTENSLSD
jgi:hypothetical protein